MTRSSSSASCRSTTRSMPIAANTLEEGASTMAATPRVLFLCPHNALRSVIAAALFKQLAAGRARGESAGTDPDERVNARTITVLREVGVDVADQKPGRVSRQLLEQAPCDQPGVPA